MSAKTLSRMAWSLLGIATAYALVRVFEGARGVEVNIMFVTLVVGWIIAGYLQERAR